MGFTEDVAKLSEQVHKRSEQVVGEESTKMALIIPFLSTLGYDVYDPTEVMPEYIADFAVKKAGQFEKVDYALSISGTVVMLVEAKARGQKAEAHDGQLSRYFNGLPATKVAIVTNGVEYRFFTDLRDKNIMDKEPFFGFNILNYSSKDIESLKLFHHDNFDAETIGRQAEEMVYVESMTELVGNQLRSPSESFMRFLLGELGIEGRITTKVLGKFEPIIKKSIQSSLVAMMTRSISQEIAHPVELDKPAHHAMLEEIAEEEIEPTSDGPQVETTAEELEAFEKVKAVALTSKAYNLEVKHKDVVSYFGVNVGKSSWWFLRFYLSPKKKSFITRLSLDEVKSLAPDAEVQEVSASLGDAVSKVIISSIDDLDVLAPLILKCYETEASRH
ncbi:type I restriction endonuclease [Leptolyngbya sp. FACHB-261]|uniref:type I restriction endonuclease n=1 Tax=Leptolyngbya sp. FACHB-261 TaxID=2692806 RepID=UPI00168828C6|nr:type I restriction endonuclease [Leptolyngbya sp. FACHB-261]MBD2100204.1 restriction endonuclease subunit R [Leptolyngbya sp. FACHB-261]